MAGQRRRISKRPGRVRRCRRFCGLESYPHELGCFSPCSWRIDRITRRLESGTTLDSASATGTNRALLVSQIRQQSALASVLPARHAFDGHYSNVENRAASSRDRRSSRIGSGRGTRAEPSRSVALRRDAKNNGVFLNGKRRRSRYFWISEWMLACFSSSERRQRRQKPAGMPLLCKVRIEERRESFRTKMAGSPKHGFTTSSLNIP
jgi:hypothetical protein